MFGALVHKEFVFRADISRNRSHFAPVNQAINRAVGQCVHGLTKTSSLPDFCSNGPEKNSRYQTILPDKFLRIFPPYATVHQNCGPYTNPGEMFPIQTSDHHILGSPRRCDKVIVGKSWCKKRCQLCERFQKSRVILQISYTSRNYFFKKQNDHEKFNFFQWKHEKKKEKFWCVAHQGAPDRREIQPVRLWGGAGHAVHTLPLSADFCQLFKLLNFVIIIFMVID